MDRKYSNAIRLVMDEFVPAAIRDSRWFMRPFFVLAYGTTDVDRFMDFKERVWQMSPEDYADFYGSLGNSLSRRRSTDLNRACLQWLVDSVPEEPVRVLDVGSGNGFLLASIHEARPQALLTGVDVVPSRGTMSEDITTVEGRLPELPFPDRSFDVVMCTHVLEHVTDLEASCRELTRVAADELLVVVPRQRAYHYTLDEHVNFFWQVEDLARHFRPHRVRYALLDGDWALRVIL